MLHLAGWGVTLAIFWLLLSGIYQPLLIVLGGLSVLLIVLLVRKMDTIDGEVKSVPVSIQLISFFSWLLVEVLKSSIEVTRLVWQPKVSLTPLLFQIKTNRKTKLGRVTYVNSITLTPGTVAVDIEDDTITVHALRKETADALATGDMEKRIPESGE